MAVTGKEVIQFFKSADLELAELVLEFGTREVEDRVEKREAISANLKKARAARKPKGETAATPGGEISPAEAQVAVATPPPQEQPQVVRRGPGRPAHVSVPAHTAAATSAASDDVLT